MPFTADENRYLADGVYGVDPEADTTLQDNFHPQAGHDYLLDPKHRNSGQYRVLETIDDQGTGLQAMAVAPIGEDGKADTTQVTIAYAGTNIKSAGDDATDILAWGVVSALLK